MAYSDVELLRAYYNNEYDKYPNKYSVTIFSALDDVYPFTNEYLKDYYEKILINKKVLSVTASGDHALHAIYAGSKDITCFDINIFAKYYAALKLAMIKTYSFMDFSHYAECIYGIPTTYTGREFYVNKYKNILDDVSKHLTEDEIMFWEEFIRLNEEEKDHLRFYNCCFSRKYNIYYNRINYDILQNRLDGVKIRYLDSDIGELSNNLREKYDFAYVSNIFSYVDVSYDMKETLKSLHKLMKKRGRICIPGVLLPSSNLYANQEVVNKYFKLIEEQVTYDTKSKRILLIKK